MPTDIELVFCGDTMLGARPLERNPFESLKSHLQAADLGFCNLETALAEGACLSEKRHVIDTPAQNLEFLTHTGFGIVHLANNHVFDRGQAAFDSLVNHLTKDGIEISGLAEAGRAKPVLITRQGVTFGFLGYGDYGFKQNLMPLRPRVALADVAALSARVDCVVVSLHWGFEYAELPSPEQQRLARNLIDAGAAMVIGHHPHVVQGIEEYHKGLIAYSLGNFQFRIGLGDVFLSRGTGIMLKVRRSAQGELRHCAFPIKLSDADEVQVCSGAEAERGLAQVAKLSAAVNRKRIHRLAWLREASRLWFPSQLESWCFRARRFGTIQWVRMLAWLLQPSNLFLLLCYLLGPKHASSRSLFHKAQS